MKRLVVTCLYSMQVLGLCPGSSVAQITEIIDATGTGVPGQTFRSPIDVATDASGNVFSTSTAGTCCEGVFKITPAGIITKIIDFTGDGAGNTLGEASGIAIDPSGNVFVTGSSTDNAFRITPAGVITEIIDATGDGGVNTFDRPWGITTDASGNVFVVGQGTDNVFKITPGGVITVIIDAAGDGGGNTLDNPFDVATDASGNVFVSGAVSDNVFKITPDSVVTEIIDATGDGEGKTFDNASGIDTDAFGNVFVSGAASDNAFKITPGGVITEIIDAAGDNAGKTLDLNFAIAADASGNAFVGGYLTNNVFKITPGGIITEIIDATGDGGGNTLSGLFNVTTDVFGNMFVPGLNTYNVFKIGAFAQETLPLSADGTLDFAGGTAAAIVFTGVSGSGNVTVRRMVSTVTDSSSIPDPKVFDDHWVVTSDGSLTFTNAEVRFDVDEIPSPSFSDPSAVTIYQRSTPGSGAFSAVATSYNAGTNEIVGTGITSFSEFALGGTETIPVSITVDVKVFFEGAYYPDDDSMSTALTAILPLSQPYDSTLFDGTQLDYDGLDSVLAMPDNIVDWVLVQLRTGDPANPPMDSVATRAALLKSDGTIVDTDGTSAINFADLPDGDYYIVIFHRNHLGIITTSTVALSPASAQYDFTTASSKAFGTNPMKEVETGVWGLYAAEADVNGLNNASDFNLWLVDTKAVATGYIQTDFNMDGLNNASDFNLWLLNTKLVAVSKVP
jgi:hypothetical protein